VDWSARPELEVVLAHVVALARPLDLDHPRAQIGEQAGAVGAGEDAGEIEDYQIGQGQIGRGKVGERVGSVAHRASIAR
jgi:hypothetical protein